LKVRVRIITPPTEESIDGMALTDFKVGSVYAVPAELATLIIVEGWAEPIDGDAVPVLPPFRFRILTFPSPQVVSRAPRRRRRFTHTLLAPHAGVAAERKKRKPPRQR
jgi:hypothetical protein